MAPNFFTTTLGEAQIINSERPHGISTVVQLLDIRAEVNPQDPAVGVGVPQSTEISPNEWGHLVYTYSELSNITNAIANNLKVRIPQLRTMVSFDKRNDGPTVAILSESSMEMLLSCLGLIRMGHAVLLIAPQCNSDAIRHLLSSTSATVLLCSPKMEALGKSSLSSGCEFATIPDHIDPNEIGEAPVHPTPEFVKPSSIAFIHHSSGTTSGLPTPVPQSHAAVTAHLPLLPPDPPVATLTTTPLYHGGMADFMRSMVSCSMIWLFPPTVPVTSQNIQNALQLANRTLPDTPVKLFTGVPYIQSLCTEDPHCVQALREMDMNGVGGASLPDEVGDFLVENGVNLVSRYGTSEDGFLMSSFRDFQNDKEWNYLRLPETSPYLSFEPRDGGLFELIVLPGWPHMARVNRPDSSYATSDLFELHPTIPRAYKYVTRSDATIVLASGKKFDPTPIEDSFRKLRSVEEAIVFGQNRDTPGVLLFQSRTTPDIVEMSCQALRACKEINAKSSSHARIDKRMLVLVKCGRDWPKSSKGTALRGKAEKAFANEIEDVYTRNGSTKQNGATIPTTDFEDVEAEISKIVREVTKRKIDSREDLFTAGVDSIMATVIRRQVSGRFQLKSPFSSNVVYEQRTIQGLAQFLVFGSTTKVSDFEMMQGIADRFALTRSNSCTPSGGSIVILTGVTGALGSHILSALSSIPFISKMYCLVRASSPTAAYMRLADNLRKRHLSHVLGSRIEVLSASLDMPDLSLSPSVYSQLANTANTIIHAAWPVNFLAPLASFMSALTGLKNLLSLTHTGQKKRFVFCSSVASVINASSPILERFSENPDHSSPLGYSQSKWVAEQIVHRAGEEVVRIGQLSGDTKEGVWNADEGWPMLLQTLKTVGCLPVLPESEVLSWLPVDVAGRVIARIAVRKDGDGKSKVWHVLNKKPVEWEVVLGAVESWVGEEVERVRVDVWIEKLEEAEREGRKVKLLKLWKEAYGETSGETSREESVWSVENTESVHEGFGDGVEITTPYLHRVFAAWKAMGIEFHTNPARNRS